MSRISVKESLRRRIARAVLRKAWKLIRRAMGYCWSTVLRFALCVARQDCITESCGCFCLWYDKTGATTKAVTVSTRKSITDVGAGAE